MRTMKLSTASVSRRFVALALGTAAALTLVAGVQFEASAAPVKIAFRLDPRLTFGRYMGERWVTPPLFTQVQEFPKTLKVVARSNASVSWASANPSLVTVTPTVGKQVILNVNRPGQTTVNAGGVVLTVNAQTADTGALVVQITQ